MSRARPACRRSTAWTAPASRRACSTGSRRAPRDSSALLLRQRGRSEVTPETRPHLPAAVDALADRDHAAARRRALLAPSRVRPCHPMPSPEAPGSEIRAADVTDEEVPWLRDFSPAGAMRAAQARTDPLARRTTLRGPPEALLAGLARRAGKDAGAIGVGVLARRRVLLGSEHRRPDEAADGAVARADQAARLGDGQGGGERRSRRALLVDAGWEMIGVQLDAGREPGEQVDWLEGDGHWLWRAACPRPCLPSSSRHLHLRRARYHATHAWSSARSPSVPNPRARAAGAAARCRSPTP